MKRILIILMVVSSIALNAQDNHMAISMGLAMPLGDFATTGKFLENGYTDPGFNLNIDGCYIPTWYFGIGGNISFSTFGLQEEKVKNDLIDLIQTIPEIPGLDTVTNFNADTWSYANFLVGPVFALPVGKFQFNAKALFGLSVLMPPSNALDFIYNGEEYTTYNELQNARFGMLFGADIIYKLSSTYSMKIGADYFRSKTKYDVSFDYVETEITSFTSNVQVEAMHFTLGIAYLF